MLMINGAFFAVLLASPMLAVYAYRRVERAFEVSVLRGLTAILALAAAVLCYIALWLWLGIFSV